MDKPPNFSFGFSQWETSERPPESGIVEGRAGFNTNLRCLEYWDGKFWQSLAPYVIPNLVDDGVTDNQFVIQQAADTSANLSTVIAFPRGTYICSAVTFPNPTLIIALGDVTIQATGTGDLWTFEDSVQIEGMNFEGGVYSSYGDVPDIETLVRIEKAGGTVAAPDVKITRCSFTGGNRSVVITQGLRVTLTDIDIYKPYEWGVITQDGTQKLIINGLRAREVGLYEAIKLGAAGQPVSYEDLLITNFLIEDCGKLDTTPANWQEAIDCYALSLQRMRVSNGIIRNCGNGGIEIKKTSSALAPDTYTDVFINDVYVESDEDRGGGVSLNWTSTLPAVPDTAGHVHIDNLDVRYTGGGTATTFVGAGMMAWTDVEIVNSSFDSVHSMVVLTGDGSSDDIVRRPYIADNKGINLTGGISATGTIEDAIIERNYIDASSYTVYMESGTGRVSNNVLVSGTNAVRFDAGTWDYTDNRVTTPDASRGWTTVAAPTVTAAGNKRGYQSSAPGTAGAIGDLWLNSAPTAGGTEKWLCTTAGDSGAAVWKGTAIAA